MSQTAWMSEPEPEAPDLPVTSMLLRNRERGPGDTLAEAQARSAAAEARQARREADAVRDPDEIAASLISRGYAPGMMSGLAGRLADATAELEAEREKIEKGARRAEHVRGMLERGQIGALESVQRLDGDFGDSHRAEQLERRVESLRSQMAEGAQLMVPPEQPGLRSCGPGASRALSFLPVAPSLRTRRVPRCCPGSRPAGPGRTTS